MRKLWSLLKLRTGEMPPPGAPPDNTMVNETQPLAEIDKLIDQLIEEQLAENVRFAKAHADRAIRSRVDAPGHAVTHGPASEGRPLRTRYLA